MLKLERPLIFFDLETTGTNVATDRIIEIAYTAVGVTGGSWYAEPMRLNPDMPIPKEASEVHGIYDEDVSNMPYFKDVAEFVFEVFSGCDIAGYNSNNFDIPLLSEEFARCGYEWPEADVRFIDVCNIFKAHEKRDLVSAVQFYLNKDHEGAHGAEADTEAAFKVLMAQIKRYGLGTTIEELEAVSKFDNRVDLAGKLIRNEAGEVCFAFGKNKDVPVYKQPGYAEWMLKQDFPSNTKKHLKLALTEKV